MTPMEQMAGEEVQAIARMVGQGGRSCLAIIIWTDDGQTGEFRASSVALPSHQAALINGLAEYAAERRDA